MSALRAHGGHHGGEPEPTSKTVRGLIWVGMATLSGPFAALIGLAGVFNGNAAALMVAALLAVVFVVSVIQYRGVRTQTKD